MRVWVAEHDALFREAIEANDGYVFATGGDGFAAAFGRAAEAVAAAGQCQAAIAGLDHISVRMGIGTGEVQERGGDYFGPPVNRTARLMAAGHGGQVLISAVTAELVPGVELRNLGEHRLRDLGSPMLVWQLGDADFPPLRTLDERPGNLPVQLTNFIGRETEVNAIAALLGENRLVTLTGVGGVGKTRLAMQVAAEVVSEFPDGAWLCELASAGDAEGLGEVIAAVFDAPTRPGKTREESVVEFLQGKHLLLVLDNCEHLLDAAAEFAELLLRRCESIRVLATSREALAIDGEHVRGLRSIGPEDAFQLFVDRANGVRDFEVDDATAGAITEICRQLDDIPLAIELAAARVVSMQPAEIAAHLDERFRLLTGGRRRGVERHQTLRAAVEWSYSLLDESERVVFDRLGVFPASFTSEAAVSVAGGDELEEWDVIDALASLARKSMIATEAGSGDVTRYVLLETLRQYAREQLRSGGAIEETRHRHAAYYADLAERLGRDLVTPQEIAARHAALTELDNLRTAVGWSLDSQDADVALFAMRIVASLGVFTNTAPASGMGAWAARAAARLDGVSLELRVAVLGAAALRALQRGDLGASAHFAQLAVADGIPADCPSPTQAAAALGMNAAVTDTAEAIRLLREGALQLEAIDYQWGVLNLELVAAIFLSALGDTTTAQREMAMLLPRARQHGNPANLVIALFAYADAWWRDDPNTALAMLEESLALTEQGASVVVFDAAHMLLGSIRALLGDPLGAIAAFLEALEYDDRIGNRQQAMSAIWGAVEPLSAAHEHDVAAVCVGMTEAGPFAALIMDASSQDVEAHEQAREAARVALGEVRYRQLLGEGATMSYDEAIAWARREFSALLANATT